MYSPWRETSFLNNPNPLAKLSLIDTQIPDLLMEEIMQSAVAKILRVSIALEATREGVLLLFFL
jgi:hypothetical protein